MVLPIVEGMSASLQWGATDCSAVRPLRAWCDFPVPGHKADKSVIWNTEVKESANHSALWCWTLLSFTDWVTRKIMFPEKCFLKCIFFSVNCLNLIEDKMSRDKRLFDKKTAVIKWNQFLFPITHRATGPCCVTSSVLSVERSAVP